MAIPSQLVLGRDSLLDLEGVFIVEDWILLKNARWCLTVRLTVESSNENLIPNTTTWCLLADGIYPDGSVAVFPAKDGGITATFPHQFLNTFGDVDLPYRNGNICVGTEVQRLNRYVINQEPTVADQRVLWAVMRLKSWLEHAAEGTLLRPGDPFELPDFGDPPDGIGELFAFKEDSLRDWDGRFGSCGLFQCVRSQAVTDTFVVTELRDSKSKSIRISDWPSEPLDRTQTHCQGAWVLLPQIPIIEPWQAPTTWGELIEACHDIYPDVMDLVGKAVNLIRNETWPLKRIGLIGFPIPERVGGLPKQVYWRAVRWPSIASHREQPRGFSANDTNRWIRIDRQGEYANDKPIPWLRSANLTESEIRSRGRLPNELVNKRVLVIGAGALGSSLSELLTRAGVLSLTIIDGEILEIGNLARHILTLKDIGLPKAEQLAARLNTISPNVVVVGVPGTFTTADPKITSILQNVDLVVDTTGSDQVLKSLEASTTIGHCVSLSWGLGAQKLYAFSSTKQPFPNDAFHAVFDPIIRNDYDAWIAENGQPPWEGAGCWHPVFPARSDDVWLLAAVGVRFLEDEVINPTLIRATVYEQVFDETGYQGIRRVEITSYS